MKRHLLTYLGMALVTAAVFAPVSPSAVSVLVTLGAGLFGAGALIGTGVWLDDAADDIRAVQRGTPGAPGTPGARWAAGKGWHLPEDASDDRTDVLVRAAQTRYVESDDEGWAIDRLEADLDAALGRLTLGSDDPVDFVEVPRA